MTQTPPQLDYAPQPRSLRRKIWRRVVVGLIIIVLIAASVPFVVRQIDQSRTMRLYNRCLRATPQTVRFAMPSTSNSGNATQSITTVNSPDWRELNHRMSSNINSRGTVFIGSLITPSSRRQWLVGIDIVRWARDPFVLTMRSRTLNSGGHLGPPQYGPASDQSVEFAGTTNHLVIQGGVIDPADQSHFTVRYEADDKPGIIDGWLKDDGTIILEKRDESPATTTTAPAPPSPALSP